ncbi:MAG: glycosyltransferase family 39 protein [Chloroflexi bacterium]|nr:glycosyltransferase family 39 protein [Chloroflexota bacterium]
MPRLRQRSPILLSFLLVLLLAGWLYWPTLQLPLIYDTLLHIRIAGGLTLGSVWLPTEAFGFYRPMTFFPLVIIQNLFNGYPAWLLHANNVAQHMVNSGLLVWLSWRLWGDWRRGLVAGAIFATFPFSYQAVAVYGHNVHPAIVGLVLLGLHSYLTAVSQPNPRKWWLITAFLFLLMILTHETAVLFGIFAALVQINAQPEAASCWLIHLRQKEWRSLLRLPWLCFLLAGLAYLAIYQFLPISRAPQVEAVGSDLWLNGLYLLQTAVFPLAWFSHLLPNISGATVTVVSGGLVIILSGWLAWQKPVLRFPLLLAWGWWGAASGLIGLALSTEYLLRGPRLLYLGSVGVALLWAHLLIGVWNGRSQNRVRRLAWLAGLLFILSSSGRFVQNKLQQYVQLTEPVSVLQTSLSDASDDAEIVFINLPQWLDMPPTTYAVGVEFVSMLGDYLFVEELVGANLVGTRSVWATRLTELQSDPNYAYSIHDQHRWPPLTPKQTRHLFITQFAPDRPKTYHVGSLLPLTAVTPPPFLAQFPPYQLIKAAATACAGTVDVQLRWLPRHETIPDTTSVFVQVLDADGRLLAQADGPPLGIRPGLLAATPDWLLLDRRTIIIEDETAVPTTLLLGVYNFATGERSLASDNSAQPLPDNAWRLPIFACP